MKHWIETRILASIYCVVTVVLCLIYAETRTELPDWWKGHGGGIPYVMFWAAFLHFWTPSPNRILGLCVIATVGTCLLEILQLWQPAWLTAIRQTTLGAALLGSGFVWQDFPPYFMGGLISWYVLHVLSRWSQDVE